MKKIVSIVVLSMLMMMAFAITAMAAQTQDPAAVTGDGNSDYLATPKNTTSAYPNGIYLQDKNGDGVVDNIHSGYQANTDACASCHATHTGVGAALLQWATVSDTCYACHDGTIADTYDVEGGMIGATGARTYAGVFGGATAEGTNSLSKHGVGTVQIAAAPGGNAAGTADLNGTWGIEFECTSCHTPHGQGANYRILSPDANGIAMAQKVTKEQVTADATGLVFTASKANWILGYPYSKSTGVYVGVDAATAVKQSTGFTIDYRNGKVTFTAAPVGNVYLSYVPGQRVTATVTNKLLATENVEYGTGMNAFCGACHTDYNTEKVASSADVLSGTYHEAYRHKVGFTYSRAIPGLKFETGNVVTCLTCHVAHGADQTWWESWKTRSGWVGTVSSEDAGSSALKRLPNMSTCEACHQKGAGSSY